MYYRCMIQNTPPSLSERSHTRFGSLRAVKTFQTRTRAYPANTYMRAYTIHTHARILRTQSRAYTVHTHTYAYYAHNHAHTPYTLTRTHTTHTFTRIHTYAYYAHTPYTLTRTHTTQTHSIARIHYKHSCARARARHPHKHTEALKNSLNRFILFYLLST